MQYAPGEPKDEKTHAAYHAALLTGIRFQVRQLSQFTGACTTARMLGHMFV